MNPEHLLWYIIAFLLLFWVFVVVPQTRQQYQLRLQQKRLQFAGTDDVRKIAQYVQNSLNQAENALGRIDPANLRDHLAELYEIACSLQYAIRNIELLTAPGSNSTRRMLMALCQCVLQDPTHYVACREIRHKVFGEARQIAHRVQRDGCF